MSGFLIVLFCCLVEAKAKCLGKLRWANYPQDAKLYLLIVVDVTLKNLIWMVSNLTLDIDLKIIPFRNSRDTKEIIPWRKPFTSNSSPKHEIEYLVFEEHRDHSARMYDLNLSLYDPPFNLSTWINSQQKRRITLCGPKGGGSAVATQPSTGSTQVPSPNTTSPPNHRKSNNSNRNEFNGVLLAGLVLVFTTFES